MFILREDENYTLSYKTISLLNEAFCSMATEEYFAVGIYKIGQAVETFYADLKKLNKKD